MKQDTKLVHFGRGAAEYEGMVNVPVHRASTILSKDLDSYIHRFDDDSVYDAVVYAAVGTQNARSLAQAVAALEDGYRSVITSSGLAAVTMAISALVNAGDHILVTDSVYGPTRKFYDMVLARYGVEATFYEPGVGSGIEDLIRTNTRLVFLEAPGSLTFEMQDIPAICAVAKRHGVLTLMDNTWATPLFFKPLANGVDVSIQAGTKYVAGHSDLVIGMITTADDDLYRRIADTVRCFGDVAGPDECYLALRGLRTMSVRLQQHQRSTLRVTRWLQEQPAVSRVLYPALETDPGYEIWKRDFSGASGLFGLALKTTDEAAVKRMVDGLTLFSIGSSWGGFESLVSFNYMPVERDVVPWTQTPFLLRLHIGLEDADDLIADLEAGMERLAG